MGKRETLTGIFRAANRNGDAQMAAERRTIATNDFNSCVEKFVEKSPERLLTEHKHASWHRLH